MKTKIVYILLFFINIQLNGQNLVVNPSFEKQDKYGNIIDWNFLKTPLLCKCKDAPQTESYCNKLKNIIDGCFSIQMSYTPNCNCAGGNEFIGCFSYMIQKLSKPLEIGSPYKISYWVYCAKIYSRQEDSAAKHIGVLLSNKKILPRRNISIIEKNVISTDTNNLKFDTWEKVEVIIIPTFELNYLTIGVFKENTWSTPALNIVNPFIYFLDKISIEKVKPDLDIVKKKDVYYYKNIDKEANDDNSNKEFNYFFNSDSWEIADKTSIDSFAQYAVKNPKQMFYISGHTDNTVGVDNLKLSEKRVNNVLNYLISTYNFYNYRFLKGYMADSKPIANNDSEQSRAKNRRVTIVETPVKKPNACYREGLKNIKVKDYDNAFKMLNCWLLDEVEGDKILVLFDPQLNPLKIDSRWKFIENEVRKIYNKYKNPSYSFSLDSIYCEDQKYRRLAGYIQDLAGYISEIDTSRWTFPQIGSQEELKNDTVIYQHLKILLHQYGYPKEEDVGKRSAKAAAVIIIHSHDTIALKKYLPIFESYCRIGEGDWGYYAAMFDKLCVLQNVYQRYGTQFVSSPDNPKSLVRHKFESKEILNEWRRKIALPLLTDDDFNIKMRLK